MNKDIKFINNSKPLVFNVGGFAIDPQSENAWFGGDFRDLVLTVVGTGTVKVYGSAQQLPPDFTLPSTISNSYTPIALADYSLATNTILAGSAGVTVAGATKLVECNTNLLTWIAIERSADTVQVLLTETNAQ
jgi:hypothetical protein